MLSIKSVTRSQVPVTHGTDNHKLRDKYDNEDNSDTDCAEKLQENVKITADDKKHLCIYMQIGSILIHFSSLAQHADQKRGCL